jgi:23S rRNA (adenine2503-C2)-methyltransferase
VNLLDQLPSAWDLGAQPEYRRAQLIQWVFERKAESFAAMSNLPEALRTHLAATYTLRPISLARVQGSQDTTRKFLWKLEQGDFIESVLIPANVDLFGERSLRQTLCVSSQVGCAYGCKFCASGLEGWKRNLSPAEIAGQVLEAERIAGSRIQNLVFMGMGEPMANYENLMQAIEMINSPWGLNIGARHITVSTSGLVPQIGKLADQPRQLRLAISLHGATDEVRSQIMPVNRKYPLAQLLDACADYQRKKGQMITFEYILIEGVNDTAEQATLLARHARRVRAKVNLIPYNTVEGLPWKRPADDVIRAFANRLKEAGCTATVRMEKGHDIDAACGQLRLRELREAGA